MTRDSLKVINGFALALAIVGALVGFGAGLLLFLTGLIPYAWAIIVFVQAGALLGFIASIVRVKYVSHGTFGNLAWIIADVFLATSGLVLFARGLSRGDWSRALYGVIMMLAPLGYRASKENRTLASVTSVALAMTFVTLSVVNHNLLWLVAAVIAVLAAGGFYFPRSRPHD